MRSKRLVQSMFTSPEVFREEKGPLSELLDFCLPKRLKYHVERPDSRDRIAMPLRTKGNSWLWKINRLVFGSLVEVWEPRQSKVASGGEVAPCEDQGISLSSLRRVVMERKVDLPTKDCILKRGLEIKHLFLFESLHSLSQELEIAGSGAKLPSSRCRCVDARLGSLSASC